MGKSKRRLLIFFVWFAILSPVMTCCIHRPLTVNNNFSHHNFHHESTVKIKLWPEGGGPEEPVLTEDFIAGPSSGSGTVIKTNIFKNTSWVLTAAHVCLVTPDLFAVNPVSENKDAINDLVWNLEVVTWAGDTIPAEVVAFDIALDACVIKVEDIWAKPLSIASSAPKIGDKVYGAHAPLGFSDKKMMPLFEGYFSGHHQMGAVYTLPVIAGSSGGSIVNSRNQVLAIVVYGIPEFPQMCITTDFYELKEFLKSVDFD